MKKFTFTENNHGMKKYILQKITFIFLSFLIEFSFAQKPAIKVVLMGGQSNMVGYAEPETLPADYMAEFPQVTVKSSGDPAIQFNWTNLRSNMGFAGRFGPEVSLGRDVYSFSGNQKTALIKWAWDGQLMNVQFRPPSSGGTVGSCFTATVNEMTAAINELKANYTVEVIGYCWMQGEADAMDLTCSNAYEVNLTNYINDLRTALNLPDLPFVIGMIDVQPDVPYCSKIRQAEMNVAMKVPYVTIFDTQGFQTNGLYFQGTGMIELGHRFAQALYGVAPPIVSNWDFKSTNEGWNLTNHLSGTSNYSILSLHITGCDPMMVSPMGLNLNADLYKYILLNIKNPTPGQAIQISWTTDDDPVFDQAKSITQPISSNDGTFQEYIIHLNSNALWTGTISQIRFQPSTDQCSDSFFVDRIAVVKGLGKGLTGNYFQDNYNFNITNNTWTNCNSLETAAWCPPVNSTNWFTNLITSRVDATINIPKGSLNLYLNSINGLNSTRPVSVRWNGDIEFPVAGTYTFYLSGADGLRLNVNNSNLIGTFLNSGGSTDPAWIVRPFLQMNTPYLPLSATFDVSSGQVGKKFPITVEYYSVGVTRWSLLDDRGIQLEWENTSAGISKEIIHPSQLFPSDISGFVELKKTDQNLITIYPNPTDGEKIFIHSENNSLFVNRFIEIRNMQGQICTTTQLSGNTDEMIPLTNLSKGIYFVKYTDDKFSITKKLIVK